MKRTKLSRITDILNEIREIDQYMAGLQEMAENLIDDDMAVELTLTGNKPTEGRVTFNDDGDMVKPGQKDANTYVVKFFGGFPGLSSDKMTPTPDAEIHHGISQSVSLKILALLLEEKQAIKNELHKKLQRLGVEIK